MIERDTARIPELETRVVAAKAEKQREGLARHRAAIAGFVPQLVAAVEAAAKVQVEAIRLREAAVAELGENVVAAAIPHLAFNGILLPDLVAMWRHEGRSRSSSPGYGRSTAARRSAGARAKALGAEAADRRAAGAAASAGPCARTRRRERDKPPSYFCGLARSCRTAPDPYRCPRHGRRRQQGRGAMAFLWREGRQARIGPQ